mmetsp:Transcript_23375/g.39553  ORF Transcript_23375/g.39553 Transcript_23375/m.39553 type:complete len:223 (-) Transcript_23375:40-708(-)
MSCLAAGACLSPIPGSKPPNRLKSFTTKATVWGFRNVKGCTHGATLRLLFFSQSTSSPSSSWSFTRSRLFFLSYSSSVEMNSSSVGTGASARALFWGWEAALLSSRESDKEASPLGTPPPPAAAAVSSVAAGAPPKTVPAAAALAGVFGGKNGCGDAGLGGPVAFAYSAALKFFWCFSSSSFTSRGPACHRFCSSLSFMSADAPALLKNPGKRSTRSVRRLC